MGCREKSASFFEWKIVRSIGPKRQKNRAKEIAAPMSRSAISRREK